MKIEINEDSITLVPEETKELQALHTLQYRGIAGTRLIGKLPDGAQYLIKFGPDDIKESIRIEAENRRIKAESERKAKRLSNRLFKALRAAWNASKL